MAVTFIKKLNESIKFNETSDDSQMIRNYENPKKFNIAGGFTDYYREQRTADGAEFKPRRQFYVVATRAASGDKFALTLSIPDNTGMGYETVSKRNVTADQFKSVTRDLVKQVSSEDANVDIKWYEKHIELLKSVGKDDSSSAIRARVKTVGRNHEETCDYVHKELSSRQIRASVSGEYTWTSNGYDRSLVEITVVAFNASEDEIRTSLEDMSQIEVVKYLKPKTY